MKSKTLSRVMVLPRMLAFPVCALAGQWLWMQHMDELPLYANTGCVVLLTYCWFCVGGLSHELVHQNLPLGPRVTRVIAQCIGISIGIPYSVYKTFTCVITRISIHRLIGNFGRIVIQTLRLDSVDVSSGLTCASAAWQLR